MGMILIHRYPPISKPGYSSLRPHPLPIHTVCCIWGVDNFLSTLKDFTLKKKIQANYTNYANYSKKEVLLMTGAPRTSLTTPLRAQAQTPALPYTYRLRDSTSIVFITPTPPTTLPIEFGGSSARRNTPAANGFSVAEKAAVAETPAHESNASHDVQHARDKSAGRSSRSDRIIDNVIRSFIPQYTIFEHLLVWAWYPCYGNYCNYTDYVNYLALQIRTTEHHRKRKQKRPDPESNEGLAIMQYCEETDNAHVTITPPGLRYKTSKKRPTTAKIPKSPRSSRKLTNRHDAYAEHGTVNIANAGYCTEYEYGKCRHAVHIKATEGGASYGVRKLGARAATLQLRRPPWDQPRSNWTKASIKEALRAAKLPNGQQPNLAACNRWLGPRTQIRARSTTPIVAEGLSNSIITTSRFILTTSPHTRPRN
ncbi:hypothetical protein C8F04DRAFT_1237705 [Mycena alexandri]|uniref:Uncharacterized protein n=1 Tax=Mycena alexandri TaxID=1745969 RepID=A0AAD6SIE1_9AGAR|nr:hypothetical protein C8F04DRAFT_1237705 [Mycena alexandri]